jgi:hypothetical protein
MQNVRQGYREEECGQVERKLLDRYFPGVLKPKIENVLRRDAVDSAVGEPLKKARATRLSLRPFHSTKSANPNGWSKGPGCLAFGRYKDVYISPSR